MYRHTDAAFRLGAQLEIMTAPLFTLGSIVLILCRVCRECGFGVMTGDAPLLPLEQQQHSPSSLSLFASIQSLTSMVYSALQHSGMLDSRELAALMDRLLLLAKPHIPQRGEPLASMQAIPSALAISATNAAVHNNCQAHVECVAALVLSHHQRFNHALLHNRSILESQRPDANIINV